MIIHNIYLRDKTVIGDAVIRSLTLNLELAARHIMFLRALTEAVVQQKTASLQTGMKLMSSDAEITANHLIQISNRMKLDSAVSALKTGSISADTLLILEAAAHDMAQKYAHTTSELVLRQELTGSLCSVGHVDLESGIILSQLFADMSAERYVQMSEQMLLVSAIEQLCLMMPVSANFPLRLYTEAGIVRALNIAVSSLLRLSSALNEAPIFASALSAEGAMILTSAVGLLDTEKYISAPVDFELDSSVVFSAEKQTQLSNQLKLYSSAPHASKVHYELLETGMRIWGSLALSASAGIEISNNMRIISEAEIIKLYTTALDTLALLDCDAEVDVRSYFEVENAASISGVVYTTQLFRTYLYHWDDMTLAELEAIELCNMDFVTVWLFFFIACTIN